jgi:hypothetical protein
MGGNLSRQVDATGAQHMAADELSDRQDMLAVSEAGGRVVTACGSELEAAAALLDWIRQRKVRCLITGGVTGNYPPTEAEADVAAFWDGPAWHTLHCGSNQAVKEFEACEERPDGTRRPSGRMLVAHGLLVSWSDISGQMALKGWKVPERALSDGERFLAKVDEVWPNDSWRDLKTASIMRIVNPLLRPPGRPNDRSGDIKRDTAARALGRRKDE